MGTSPEKSIGADPDVAPAVVPRAWATTLEPNTAAKPAVAENSIVRADGVNVAALEPTTPGVWVAAVTAGTPAEVKAAAAV